MSNNIPEYLSLFDPEELIVCSFRYYVGRRTISTVSFANNLRKNWESLPDRVKSVIGNDLEFEIKSFYEDDAPFSPLGDPCDREAWMNLYQKYLDTKDRL